MKKHPKAVIIEHTDTYSSAEAKLSGNAKAIIIVLVAINVLIFIALPHDFEGSYFDCGPMFFGIDTDAIMHGQYYRLFTYAFIHANIMHLAANMFSLIFISLDALHDFSEGTFLLWYTAGIFGGRLAPMIYGIVWLKRKGVSLMAADRRIVLNYTVFILMMLIPGFFEEGVSWGCHLGGLIAGLVVVRVSKVH